MRKDLIIMTSGFHLYVTATNKTVGDDGPFTVNLLLLTAQYEILILEDGK